MAIDRDGFATTHAGTGTANTHSFNSISVESDGIAAGATNPGWNFVNALYVRHQFGGPSATGGRNGVFAHLTLNGATSSGNAYPYYAGVHGWADAATPDTSRSHVYGVGGLAHLLAGATGWGGAVGAEFTVGIDAGASANVRAGLVVNGLGGSSVKGTATDALVVLTNQDSNTAKFNYGILIRDLPSHPIDVSGTIFAAVGSGSCLNGVDLSGYNFSGSAFKSAGFSVDGLGNILAKTATLATGANRNVVVGRWGGDGSYGGVAVNGTLAAGAMAGIFGGNSTDTTLYLASPAAIILRPNGAWTNTVRVTSSVIVSLVGAVVNGETAIPAGGNGASGYKFSSTPNFGIFFGSGVPTLHAAKGSLYLRSDGTGPTNRTYVNTNGGNTWAALTSTA